MKKYQKLADMIGEAEQVEASTASNYVKSDLLWHLAGRIGTECLEAGSSLEFDVPDPDAAIDQTAFDTAVRTAALTFIQDVKTHFGDLLPEPNYV